MNVIDGIGERGERWWRGWMEKREEWEVDWELDMKKRAIVCGWKGTE